MNRHLHVLLIATALLGGGALGCDPPSNSNPLPPRNDPHYTDLWIEHQVEARLAGDPQLAPFRLDVKCQDGVVYVQGSVPTQRLRERAGRVAAASPYVQKVHNNVAVVDVPIPPR